MDTRSDAQVVETISHEAAKITDGGKRKLLVACIVLFLLFLGAFSWAAKVTYQRAQDQAVRATGLAQEVAEACADPNSDTASLGDLCKKADEVVDKAPDNVIVGAKGEQGEPGNAGSPGPTGAVGPPPTFSQIYAAVVQALGTPVAQEKVRAAVNAYCATRNQCRGLSGENGTDGTNGSDGQAGQPGQNGQDGKDGKDGKDGVPFTIIFTLDETTVTCTVTSSEPVACTSSTPSPSDGPTQEPPIIEVTP